MEFFYLKKHLFYFFYNSNIIFMLLFVNYVIDFFDIQ